MDMQTARSPGKRRAGEAAGVPLDLGRSGSEAAAAGQSGDENVADFNSKLGIGQQDFSFRQKQKVNHLKTKKEVPKALKRQHIEFQSITAGSFFSSRVLVDEAMMKNYIKANKP